MDREGAQRIVDASLVNDYLRRITGQDFSAKDFRTWVATVLAAKALRALGPARSAAEASRKLSRAFARVAKALGNTPAICRESYVHPSVIRAYREGRLLAALEGPVRVRAGLDREEAALVALLRRA